MVTDTSALAATLTFDVDELLPGVGSAVTADAVAVLLIVAPFAVDEATWTTKLKTADAPAAIEVAEHVMVPFVPTAGGVQMNVRGTVSETNVTLAGSTSVSVTVCASLGPLFITVTVKVRFVPAITGFGDPLFVTLRSAEVVTSVLAGIDVLFVLSGSGVVLDTVAEFVTNPVAEGDNFTTNVNTAFAPAASVVAVQLIVPVPPTAGVVHGEKAGGALAETKVVLAGTTSATFGLAASLGPLFVMVTV